MGIFLLVWCVTMALKAFLLGEPGMTTVMFDKVQFLAV